MRRVVSVGAGYAAQGLGYAALVTALPLFKDRQDITDGMVSAILLGVCVAGAGGSVLAEWVAARWGSRFALVAGLLTIATGLGLTTVTTPMVLFTAIFVLYGLGLGMVDAGLSMQGVLVQARLGRSVMSRLFAAYTAAAIVAALLMSGFSASGAGLSVAVGAAAVFAALVGVIGLTSFEPGRTVVQHEDGGRLRPANFRRVVLICGVLIFTAFLADSAVSTWSTVYLHDSLNASDSAAPLGYAAYQATVLVSRLAGDHLVPRIGRVPSAAGCLLICALGCGLVVAVPTAAVAVLGFALTGIGVGVLVPLTFSAVGDAVPGQSDDVIARVNIFNYGGALLGAVAIGGLSDPIGLRLAFLVPVVGLLLTLSAVRALGDLREGTSGPLLPAAPA